MRFPNAQAGVKKIFSAEILALIASFCSMMMVVFLYFMTKTVDADGNITSGGAAVASLGGTAVFGMAATVLAVISFIFKIIGVKKASIDEDGFKTAFYLILGGIAVALVKGVVSSFTDNNTVSNIFSIINDVITLAITIFIIQSIINLAIKLNDDDMVKRGNNLFKIIIAMYVLIIIANIVILITGSTAGVAIAGVFGLISGILSIVQYILYLAYLNKAKKMLEA